MAMIIMKKDDRMGKAGVLQVNCSYNALIVQSPLLMWESLTQRENTRFLWTKQFHTSLGMICQPMQNCFDQKIVEMFLLLLE